MNKHYLRMRLYIPLLVSLFLLAGCLDMEFTSPGRKVNEPLYDEYCWACLWCNCWWWWSDNPSKVCKIPDGHAVKSQNGFVYRPGYREIKISHSWWTVFLTFGTLGAFTPMKVTCYETKDARPSESDEEAVELK